MTAVLKFMAGIVAITLFAAALLILVANALAHAFRPDWAIRQPWSLLQWEILERSDLLWGTNFTPVEKPSTRPTGIIFLFLVSLIIRGFFGHADDSVYVRAIWPGWLFTIAILTAAQGFAWALAPRWLARRYPSMTSSFTGSKAGRIGTRLTGVLLLGLACFIAALAALA